MTLRVLALLLWALPVLAQPIVLDCVTKLPTNTPTRTPTVTPSASTTPFLVGFIPGVGNTRDVVIDSANHRAYIASEEFGLSVVDVSTPSAPVMVGALNVPFYGYRVAINLANNLAAIVSNNSGMPGLRLIDISNPAALQSRGGINAVMNGVAIAGNVAYTLATVGGVPILAPINITNPSSPSVLAQFPLLGAQDIKVVGNFAYVAAGGGGLQIVNITDPTHPVLAFTLPLGSSANGIAIAGNFAFVANNVNIKIVNITTPTAPFVVSTIAATAATAAAVAGNELYVIDLSNLKIFDVTNPALPVPQSSNGNSGAERVAVDGAFAYLTSPLHASPGLYDWSVANPVSPSVVAHLQTGVANNGIAQAGSTAIVTLSSNGLRTINTGTPSAPVTLAGLNGTYGAVTMQGNFGYAILSVPGNPTTFSLAVINVQTPGAPFVSGQAALPAGLDVAVSGNTAYVAAGTSGFTTVNVTNSAAPNTLTTIPMPGTAFGVAVSGTTAYVADNTSLQFVNVANPSAPSIIAPGLAMTSATDIAASGTTVYVVDNGSLKIVNASNPASPQLQSTTVFGNARSVVANGTRVYLVTPSSGHGGGLGEGVYIIDASNAAAPQLVKQVVVPGSVGKVAYTSPYVYAGDDAAIIDIVQP